MKKKILLLACENEVEHVLYIGSSLKELGHEVKIFVCDFLTPSTNFM